MSRSPDPGSATTGDLDPDCAADLARPARRRARPWEIALSVGAALVFFAALGMVAWRYADQPAHADVISFSIDSPQAARITVDVTKDPAKAARCVVEALSVSSAQVGLARFDVPPQSNGARTTRWVVDIPTQELATTAVVKECDIVDNR